VEESYLCQELDQALTVLETQLKQDTDGPVEAFAGVVVKSKFNRAEARVLAAAAKFGSEQERIAEVWVSEVRNQPAMNPAHFLEAQATLFGECILDDDGGSERCKELQAALGALQVSAGVRGKVVSTSALRAK